MMPSGREQARSLLTRRSRHARFAGRVIPDANGFERAICALRGRLAITLPDLRGRETRARCGAYEAVALAGLVVAFVFAAVRCASVCQPHKELRISRALSSRSAQVRPPMLSLLCAKSATAAAHHGRVKPRLLRMR